MDEELKEALLRTIEERAKRPTRVQFEEMVNRGVIDNEGRVLIRMPRPPWEADEKPKRKRRRD